MQLSYRGINYEANPAQNRESAPSVPQAELRYRGATYRLNQVAKTEALEAVVKQRTASPVNLTYRGANYRLNQAANAEALETVFKERQAAFSSQSEPQKVQDKTPVLSLEDKARALNAAHYKEIKHRQQVMLNRAANELGLAESVADYWNHIQGQIHPTFRLNYDRSHATLS